MDLIPKRPLAFEKNKKIKTMAGLSAAFNHNYRKGDVPDNAENERSYLNEELVPEAGKNYVETLKEKLKELDITPRKNAVLSLEVILEPQNVEDGFDLEEWKKTSLKWLQDYFGKDNVISAMYHGDESNPHIHGMVIPIVDGKLKCYHFTDGREKMSNMQTSYAAACSEMGLERGIEGTAAHYVPMKRIRKATELEASRNLPAPTSGETLDAYYERVNQYYKDVRVKHFVERNDLIVRAENTVKMEHDKAEKVVKEAEQKVSLIEQKFEELKKAVKPLIDENTDLKKKVDELELKLQTQRRDFNTFTKDGMGLDDFVRSKSLKKAFAAFDRGLLGENTLQDKETVLDILNRAIRAYDADELAKGEQMDNRENGEEISEIAEQNW